MGALGEGWVEGWVKGWVQGWVDTGDVASNKLRGIGAQNPGLGWREGWCGIGVGV